MKRRIRGFYFFISSVIIALLHIPVAFAKPASGPRLFKVGPEGSALTIKSDEVPADNYTAKSVYDSLRLDASGLSRQAYDFAKKGLERLTMEGRINNSSVLSIIDFSLPGNKKRLFVIDIKNYRVLYNTYAAHGKNSGKEQATSFSNQHSSYKSSPGFYITKETYLGKKGLSLKLEGLEKGINDNAFARGIVVHGAAYVSESLAKAQGYVGRSEGCPAVPVHIAGQVINTIKNGSCLFIYHPAYTHKSAILN